MAVDNDYVLASLLNFMSFGVLLDVFVLMIFFGPTTILCCCIALSWSRFGILF